METPLESPVAAPLAEPAEKPVKRKMTPEERKEAARQGTLRFRAERGIDPVTKRVLPKAIVEQPAAQEASGESSPDSPEEPDNTDAILGMIDRLLARGQWPARVRRNLEQRRHILRMAKGNVWGQARLLRWCKASVCLFIDLFGWQYNPKKRDARMGPFVLFGFQRRALLNRPETTGKRGILWCYEHEKTVVVEKSRDIGASWLFLFFQDWLCLFHEYVQALNISKSADAVDCKSPDSLFAKLRFIHRNLPAWLKGPVDEMKMYMGYNRTNSAATGEASTSRAGVGGRASVIFTDEFSKIKEDQAIREYTANTSDCRYFNGTHVGTGTEFFRMTKSAEVVKITMHWCEHPDKNAGLYSYDKEEHRLRFWEYTEEAGLVELAGPKVEYPPGFEFVMDGSPMGGPFPGLRSPWYDKKCREIGQRRAIAMELDIDPAGSVSTPFDPQKIHDLKQNCKPPSWEGDAEVDAEGRLVKLIERHGGPLKLWVRLVNGEPPRAMHAAGADVSAGTGATPSCLSLGNMKTGQKVARYANAHIQPDKFGLLAAALCGLFCDEDGVGAKIAWENLGGPGVSFGKALMETAGHRHVYEMGEEEMRPNRGHRKAGFNPTGNTKNTLLSQYILALDNFDYVNYDEEALEDCLNFKYDAAGRIMHTTDVGRNPEAARENHGDLVIADALCSKLIGEAGRLTARKKAELPTTPPEENILTVAGRQAARRRHKVGGW